MPPILKKTKQKNVPSKALGYKKKAGMARVAPAQASMPFVLGIPALASAEIAVRSATPVACSQDRGNQMTGCATRDAKEERKKTVIGFAPHEGRKRRDETFKMCHTRSDKGETDI